MGKKKNSQTNAEGKRMAESNGGKAPYLTPHNVVVEPGDRPGYWRVSAVVLGRLVARTYHARTKREAADRFCGEENRKNGY